MNSEKPKAYIFGAGASPEFRFNQVSEKYSVLGFVDNNPLLQGKNLAGVPVHAPDFLAGLTDYDAIVVMALSGYKAITAQLLAMGIERGKIDTNFVAVPYYSRIHFLEKLAEMIAEKDIKGAVAEGGVYQGEFAKEINRVFPQRKLYLFDTFEGFDDEDLGYDASRSLSNVDSSAFKNTSVETVLSKLPHPGMCKVRKGVFPQTAIGLEEEVFCFANLDFDLYGPTLAGLEFFVPRIGRGYIGARLLQHRVQGGEAGSGGL